ncbi:MAG: helix-turn-helix transcriptional regulator [Bacteroidales bacterium]|nr:helix-turn-helix transcriptional regulator [Bacteroidales bacterium]
MIDKIKLNSFTGKNELINLTKETKHLFAYLVFFEQGSGRLKINNTNVEIEKNSIFSLPILSTIDYSGMDSKAIGKCIAFNKEARDILLIHSFKLFCPFTGVINIIAEKSVFEKISFYLKDIKTELEMQYFAYDEIIYLQNALIIKHINRNISDNSSTSQISNINLKRFADLVDKEFKNHHDIEFYSSKLSVSTKTLERLAKQHLNITPKQIIKYRINAEAIRLLLHTQNSIKEIAYELNFSSPDYFNFFFKKLNNISPSAYKNKMSENLRFLS